MELLAPMLQDQHFGLIVDAGNRIAEARFRRSKALITADSGGHDSILEPLRCRPTFHHLVARMPFGPAPPEPGTRRVAAERCFNAAHYPNIAPAGQARPVAEGSRVG